MIYDTFQKEAIRYVEDSCSVIVSAPTGAGKTVIAEYVIEKCLSQNKNVIYTAPIKALSNQKFRDFRKKYGNKIGILTGDVSINPFAPALIMTTEIFRNKVIEEDYSTKNYSWVIFDEIHYLDDYERGTVWEEALIFLPKHIKILALSATIPNIDEFAEWIQSIHEMPLKVVKESNRPVKLHFFYQCNGEIMDNLKEVEKIGYKKSYFHHLKPNRPTSLIKHLFENNRLPCIYFSFSRRRCEYLAEEMIKFDFMNLQEKKRIKEFYNKLCESFGLTKEESAKELLRFIEKGIAYHHAGMLPTLKEVVEQLFTSRLIKVIFTTETFALGINMPARTVVFDELKKPYGRFYSNLKTRDFYQMAGRAGRRKIDTEGFVYCRVNPRYLSFQGLTQIIYGKPEIVRSKFNTSYATTLHFYEKFLENLYEVYRLSFHYFKEKRHSQKRAIELLDSKIKILKELGYIKDKKLTEKGKFASKIYGYELPISELYEKGILEELSEIELGVLCLALVFEPRKNIMKPRLSKRTKKLITITERVLSYIHRTEKRLKITPLSKKYYYHLSPCIEAWMRGEEFDKILWYTNVDEGEIVRYFRMTIQVLREILDTPVNPMFKEKIRKTIHLINRDIINAEQELNM